VRAGNRVVGVDGVQKRFKSRGAESLGVNPRAPRADE